MANIYLSTAGIKVGYGVESTAGAKPTTFTEIPDLVSIGSINPEPQTIKVTPLSETEWERYIDGLKDVGGSITMSANLTESFITAWDELVQEAKTAKAAGKSTWFAIVIPGLTKSFMFAGNPATLGFEGAEVSSALQSSVYITPTKIDGFVDKVTI